MSPASSAASAEGSPPGSATAVALSPCGLKVSGARAAHLGKKLKVGAASQMRTVCCAAANVGRSASAAPKSAAFAKIMVARMSISSTLFRYRSDRRPTASASARVDVPADQRESSRSHERNQNGDASEYAGGIICRRRLVNEQAEPLRRRGEFADDHPDHAVGNGQPHAQHYEWRGGRQKHVVSELTLICTHDKCEIDKLTVDAAHAGEHVVEDQEEDHDRGERDLRSHPDAKPDDEERRQRDLGYAVEGHHIRPEDAREPRRAAERVTPDHPAGHTYDIAKHEFLPGRPQVRINLS